MKEKHDSESSDFIMGSDSSAGKLNEEYVLRYVLACRDEAGTARTNRMSLNRQNYNAYQLQQNFSHKRAGQSTEVLPKVKMSTEQTRSFFVQALADISEWFRVVPRGPVNVAAKISNEEVYKLTNYFLKEAKYYSHVGNNVFYALLGAISVTQVTGKLKSAPKYVARTEGKGKSYRKWLEKSEDKTWMLKFNEIRQANYYPDPTGAGLYEIFEEYVDKSCVLDYSEGEYAIYDKSEVKELKGWGGDIESNTDGAPLKTEETGQNPDYDGVRPRIKLTRFSGNIIDQDTGKLLYENVLVTIANDREIIQKPTPNPFWHQESDIITAALMEVPGSVWHTALMDSPAALAQASTELFNLMLDAGMSSVHGIKQIRVDALDDVSQISDGIRIGDTLKVNSSLPIGAKVLEDVIVGNFPQQLFNVQNILQQELNAASLSSDLRGGVTPQRQQSATAVVEQGNSINSVMQGITKAVEERMIQPELTKSWQTIAQNWDLIQEETFVSLFGDSRGKELAALDPEDVFADTVNGLKFEVYGLSLTLNQKLEYQKLMTLLQSVGASPLFQEPFLRTFDPTKLLGEIVTTLGIDKKKIEVDQQAAPAMPPGMPEGMPGGEAPAGPDQMSQVPQPGGDSLATALGNGGGPQPAAGQF